MMYAVASLEVVRLLTRVARYRFSITELNERNYK